MGEIKIRRIRFEGNWLVGIDAEGAEYRQSLLWYPSLKAADADARQRFSIGHDGIHWRGLDTDVSFESFGYEDAAPSELQTFFLAHKELNIAEFAARIGINATLLRNYINGVKKPSEKRSAEILDGVRTLGREYATLETSHRPDLVDGYSSTHATIALAEESPSYGRDAIPSGEFTHIKSLIADAMKTKGLSQKCLAARIGVSPSRVSDYVTGRAEPTLRIAARLCASLDISPKQMMGL